METVEWLQSVELVVNFQKYFGIEHLHTTAPTTATDATAITPVLLSTSEAVG